MRRPNLTPPRPVSQEPRPVGTRAVGPQLSLPEPPSFRAVRNVVLALGAIVATGVFVGAPYRAADRLARALESGNAAKLEQAIDFPAIREDLKRQAIATLSRGEDGETGLPVGSQAFANAMVSAAIDATVQPELVAKLKDAPIDSDARIRIRHALKRARLGYDGPMSFSIKVTLVDVADVPVTIGMSRSGVFDWKVSSVTLPSDLNRLAELGKGALGTGQPPKLDALVRAD